MRILLLPPLMVLWIIVAICTPFIIVGGYACDWALYLKEKREKYL